MKEKLWTAAILAIAAASMAATTIDPANKYAYGANIGWINAAGDTANGAVIGEAFCSGYLYAANCGWISLGDGTPADGQAYANDSATDFGVNHDGAGNLTGFAYGANIGWINFEQTYGQPQVDLITGAMSGYAYAANVGWINVGTLKVASISPGPDTDSDGIPDAWEYGHTNVLSVLASGGEDHDGDGVSDIGEYKADTDPFDAEDSLRITDFQAQATVNDVTWNTHPTRNYRLQTTTNLVTGAWTNTPSGLIHTEAADITIQDTPNTNAPARFYRVNVTRPLSE